jgi:hypothetical protein
MNVCAEAEYDYLSSISRRFSNGVHGEVWGKLSAFVGEMVAELGHPTFDRHRC